MLPQPRLSFRWLEILITTFTLCIIYVLHHQAAAPEEGAHPSIVPAFMHNVYSGLTEQVSKTTREYAQLMSIKDSNRSLTAENVRLKSQLLTLNSLRLENERLRQILDFKSTHPQYKFVAAKMTTSDMVLNHSSYLINKGSKDGIHKLAGVMTPDGVFGYITDVSEHSARVLYMTDRLSSIDAVVQRTQARGLIAGYRQTVARLKYIERPEDMIEGDLIVTSSDQSMFPAGLPIGTVQRLITKKAGVGHQADVVPSVKINQTQELLVLVKEDKQ